MHLTYEQLDDVAAWLRGWVRNWGNSSYQTAANHWNASRGLQPLRPVVTKRDISRAAKLARSNWPASFKWRGAKKGK